MIPEGMRGLIVSFNVEPFGDYPEGLVEAALETEYLGTPNKFYEVLDGIAEDYSYCSDTAAMEAMRHEELFIELYLELIEACLAVADMRSIVMNNNLYTVHRLGEDSLLIFKPLK